MLSTAQTRSKQRMAELAKEYQMRQMEALRCYRPTEKQLAFHTSRAAERIIRGGKRSGKTICASAEVASAITGIPILGLDGEEVPRQYPRGDMLVWVIGWDLSHIGQTIHRVLFEPGYFRILPNEDGSWRALNPAQAADLARMGESRPAGPMIPPRLIDMSSWAWENKAEHCFKSVLVRNPWGTVKVCAFPSTSIQAKQGDAVDLIWIDEDVRFSQHVAEWQDRLADRKGRLVWSAWPHGSNDALVEMSERAEEQQGLDEPDVLEVVLRFSDNPFIDDEEKRKSIGRMRTEEDRRSRDFGEFLFDTICMYEFLPEHHLIYRIYDDDPAASLRRDDWLNRYYTRYGCFPEDWTRYLAVDPSHTRTAVLFGVVPPAEFEGHDTKGLLIIENELIAKKHSADELAEEVWKLIQGKRYEAFVMDFNMGRQTRVGAQAGNTVMGMYEAAFARRGLKSRSTESAFIPGNNSILTRCMEVRSMLRRDEEGKIRLRLLADKTYHTQREFGTYRKKVLLDQILDEPANPRKHDAMAALEYLVSYVYNAPEPYVDPARFATGSPAYREAQRLLAKWKQKNNSDYCHIGPGEAA